MAKSLLDLILDSIFDENWKGKIGEKYTERELNLGKLFGRKGRVLRNIYLPKENGETSEVDVVFITQKGIFVFESKNYSGWIFGDEKSKNWTAMLPNKQKNQFYNPILQNRTHLKWMRNFVGDDIPLFSIIVFSNRCELKKVTVYSEDIKVIKRDWTNGAVKYFWNKNPDVLSDEKIEELYNRLKELTNVDAAVKATHIENIKKNHKALSPTATHTPLDKGQNGLFTMINEAPSMKCPKCGGDLVLRTAKKGENIGKQFYGCSAFPKCRYVKDK